MKKKKLSFLILILAMGLVLYFTLKDDFSGIILQLSKVNILIFLFAILIFLLSLLFKSISLITFLKEYKNDYKISNSFKLTLISQFLNGITPFQTGGQPFQIYLLKKDGIRISDSTNAMLKDFISYQIALILMGLFAIVINYSFGFINQSRFIDFLVFFGFSINIIVLIFLLLIISVKKAMINLVMKVFDLLYRFKFIRRLSITKEKIKESLNHFYDAGNEIKKNKRKLFQGVFYNLISLVLLYVIPFFIFSSLGNHGVTLLNSVVFIAFVMLIGNFIPIPGATGGIEYSFLQFFGVCVKNPLLSSGMLL